MDNRPIPNLQNLVDMWSTCFQRADSITRALKSAHKLSTREDGLFLVRNTRTGVSPLDLIHTVGTLGFAGKWYVGRIRKGEGMGSYDVVIRKPNPKQAMVYHIHCYSEFSLKRVVRDLSERGSQSFLSPFNTAWVEKVDQEFIGRGFPA